MVGLRAGRLAGGVVTTMGRGPARARVSAVTAFLRNDRGFFILVENTQPTKPSLHEQRDAAIPKAFAMLTGQALPKAFAMLTGQALPKAFAMLGAGSLFRVIRWRLFAPGPFE